METTQEEFQVRVYLKTELAQLYAPHLNPEAALRKMRKWIHRKTPSSTANCMPARKERMNWHTAKGRWLF